MTDNVIFKTGDLFDTKLPAIGHGVNIYGVMGAGVAVLIRRRFPAVFAPYRAACLDRSLVAGGMLPVEVEPDMWVFNLASQDKPGPNAKMEWVESSLVASFEEARKLQIEGFAIPRIASDIGGLKWVDVKGTIVDVAADYPEIVIEAISLPNAPN